MRPNPVIAVTLAALLAAAAAVPAAAGPETFEEARALAAEQGRPVLVDFFTTWCGPCKRFTKDVGDDAEIQKALEDVVLFKTDAEKEGKELAETHSVQGYPTFVLMNADGQPMDRWYGYAKSHFLSALGAGLADPTTLAQKQARFHESPTATDAQTLARFHVTSGEYEDAVVMYRKAEALGSEDDLAYEIFDAVSSGVSRADLFSVQIARKAADGVLAADTQEPRELVDVYFTMKRLERKSETEGLSLRYLAPALASTEGVEELADARASLEIEHALRVEGNGEKAYGLKLAAQPEGWKDDPGQLNGMAWWCFENGVKLEEAEALAKRGVELSPPGADRAGILDTLAEICNARGNCPDAVQWIRQAVAEAPERGYFQKQLERFEAVLASSN